MFEKFAVLFLLLLPVLAQQWNSQDYQKREHSLIKPFQGEGRDGMGFGLKNAISRRRRRKYVELGFPRQHDADE